MRRDEGSRRPGAEGPAPVAERPAGLSERLAGAVLDLVAERRLGPGDVLPSVRDLAGRFGVTPPTMREALRRLQATDTVELRHGSGVYVGPGLHRTLMPNPNSRPVRADAPLQLAEARLTVEPDIAAMAAERRTEAHLARLETALDAARQDPAGRAPRLDFHRELARASGNQVLYELVDSLLSVRARQPRTVRRLLHGQSGDHEQHMAIFGAVRARHPSGARSLTRTHLQQVREDVARHTG